VLLFSESTTRFVIEVTAANEARAAEVPWAEVPLLKLGQTVKEPRLRIANRGGEWVVWASLADLKEAWQKPLRW
jgi:phosphoribosylformylglycinamidine synthase